MNISNQKYIIAIAVCVVVAIAIIAPVVVFIPTYYPGYNGNNNGTSWEIDATGTVTNIVDGDTLDVSGVGRIRLADINAPEAGDAGGPAATSYLSSLVNGKTVYVDIDDIYTTDPYGRIVAVLYIDHDASQCKNINKQMLDGGHAVISNYNNEFNPYSWTLLVPKL